MKNVDRIKSNSMYILLSNDLFNDVIYRMEY